VPDRTDNHKSRYPFYAKILLFGEYSVIFNSMALLMPYSRFTARFSFLNPVNSRDNDFALESNAILRQYGSWLCEINRTGNLKGVLDTRAFMRDVEDGLFLDSDIPRRYGVGSSGALCAAVYDRYSVKRIGDDAPGGIDATRTLKTTFALMESWFHGTSSGMDPLTSYLRSPVLLEPGEKISVMELPVTVKEKGVGVFLVDTGRPGDTGPLVKLFLEMSKENSFSDKMESTLIPAVNRGIKSMLSGDIAGLMAALETISLFQATLMKAMIPDPFIKAWQDGLSSGDYYLKLCGSGGGGYLLGFTRDIEKTFLILKSAGFNLSTI
jgi:mevalonate kinase